MDRPSVLGFQVDSVLWLPVQLSLLPVPPCLSPRGHIRMLVGYRLGIDWITIGARLNRQKSITESRPNIDPYLTVSKARGWGCVQSVLGQSVVLFLGWDGEKNKEANTWVRVCLLVDLFGSNLGERDHAFAVGAVHQNAEGLGQTDVTHMFGLLYRREGIELVLMQAAVALEVVDSHVADT